MRKSLIIILILFYNLTFGQEIDGLAESHITEFKSEMKKENISDFFIVKHITYGGILIPDSEDPNPCYPKNTYFTLYAFWNKGTESYVKKFDNCGGFYDLKLESSKPVDFFKQNLSKIKEEEVEFYKIKPDSIVDGNRYSFTSTRSHSSHRFYWFNKDSLEFKKHFDKYNLETEKDNRNLNFDSNNKLSIVKLNLICEEIINGLEKKKMFNRIK
jgi:hypothetical protein